MRNVGASHKQIIKAKAQSKKPISRHTISVATAFATNQKNEEGEKAEEGYHFDKNILTTRSEEDL